MLGTYQNRRSATHCGMTVEWGLVSQPEIGTLHDFTQTSFAAMFVLQLQNLHCTVSGEIEPV